MLGPMENKQKENEENYFKYRCSSLYLPVFSQSASIGLLLLITLILSIKDVHLIKLLILNLPLSSIKKKNYHPSRTLICFCSKEATLHSFSFITLSAAFFGFFRIWTFFSPYVLISWNSSFKSSYIWWGFPYLATQHLFLFTWN